MSRIEIFYGTKNWEVRILSADPRKNSKIGTQVRVSLLYAEKFDSDSAPQVSDRKITRTLAAKFGGQWKLARPGWDGGDHPTRLESIATFEKFSR